MSTPNDAIEEDSGGLHQQRCMERLARGEQSALGELYGLHGARVRALVRAIVRDAATADDLTHEVFLAVWRNARQYSVARGPVQGWILLQARSRALDYLRSAPRKRNVHLEESVLEGRPAPMGPSDPEFAIDLRHVPEALQSLSEAERQVLWLGTMQGSSCSEIAAELSIPIGTVKSRTQSALTKIRNWFRLTESAPLSGSGIRPTDSTFRPPLKP